MNKYLLLSGIIAGITLCACNNNEDVLSDSSQTVKGINISIEDADFESDLYSRSSYVVDPTSGFISSWTEGDTIGIYPIGGDQVAFPISEGEGSKTAKFDGGAWALRSSFTYAAYYPFSRANYYVSETAIPVTYTGQKQTANSSTTHLTRYDYLAAAATSPDGSGNVDLTMKRLGCFARIQIPIKVAGTFTELRISTSEALLTAAGTVNLRAAEPSITTTTAASSITVALQNIAVAQDGTLEVYIMFAPVDLSGKTLSITLKNSANNYYYYTIAGKNMKAGKAYNYAISNVPDANGHDYVDLGLPSGTLWATMNVGATSPEGIGHFYFWGDTTPVEEPHWTYYNIRRNYKFYTYTNWDNNQYQFTITKYSSQDEKAFLDEEDDVAHVEWGGSWRMPTITEIQELIDNCTFETLTISSTKVVKAIGPNGNFILLPYGGRIRNENGTYDSTTKKYKFTPSDTSSDSSPYGGFWSNQITPSYVSTESYGYTAATCMKMSIYQNVSSLETDVWSRPSYCMNVRPVL